MVARDVFYCLPEQIENFIPELPTLTDSTTPSLGAVKQLIHFAEGEIDRLTGYGWRFKRVRERQDLPIQDFMANRPHGHSIWFDGIPIKLLHRQVQDLDADKGDVLTVRVGSSDEDWLSTKTEGYNQAYYIDNERGVLNIYRRWAFQFKDKIFISYRYGDGLETDLAGDLESTTTTITVDSTANFPPAGSLFLCKGSTSPTYEVVRYNGQTATTFTDVVRGQESTTATTFSTDDLAWYVPEEVQFATVLRTAILLAQNHNISINENLGAGQDYVEMSERARMWQEQYDRQVEMLREWKRI